MRADAHSAHSARLVRIPKQLRAGSWLAWATWILLAALGAAGFRHARVENSIDSWAPELKSVGPFESYVVLGGAVEVFDDSAIRRALRDVSSVSLIIDRTSVAQSNTLTGIDPRDFVVSPDGRYAGMFCFRGGGVSDDEFVRQVTAAVATIDPDGHISIAGPAAYHAAVNDYSQRRMPLILGVIVLIGTTLLAWVCGSWKHAIIGGAAVAMGQITLIGLLTWSGRPIDLSMSMIAPLMTALGMSYAAQTILRPNVAPILRWCVATTALGTLSFITCPLAPIRNFAILGSAGVLIIWLAVTMLVRPSANPATSPWLAALLEASISSIRFQRPIVLLSIVALLLGCLAAVRSRIAGDPISYFPAESNIAKSFRTLDAKLTGMLPFQVVADGKFDVKTMLELSPSIRKVIDITAFISPPWSAQRTYWCLADNAALDVVIRDSIEWVAAAGDANLRVLGVVAQINAARNVLKQNAWQSIALMTLIAAGAVWMVSRSLKSAAAAALVCLMPIALLLMVMQLLGVAIEIPALMIGAISVGVSVDDALHLNYASRAFGSWHQAKRDLWRPCVGSSLINVACLLTFLLSPLGVTQQFGAIMAGAVGLAAVFNQLLMVRYRGPN